MDIDNNSGELMDKVTLIVSSCDKYSDLWNPFFTVLKAEWQGLEHIHIVLNTESKSYSYKGLNISTFQLYREGENPSWTERLRKTLERVGTKYVITLLDDFFMMGKVDSQKILKHIEWMEKDQRVSVFSYMETFTNNIQDRKYESFERRPLIALYKFNCQAALWRRTRLISYLKNNESPWEWETYGNWRSYRHPFHKFYSYIEGENYVFPYIYKVGETSFGGLGLYRGRWYLPYVQPVFEKHGIEIDYSIRGDISEKEIRDNITDEGNCSKKSFQMLRKAYGDIKFIIFNARFVFKHFINNYGDK